MTGNDNSLGADDSIPIACVLDAIPPEQRSAHFALLHQLFGQAIQEQRDLPDGYECRFVVAARSDYVTRG